MLIRRLFYLLLAVNVLVFMYRLWVVPGPGGKPPDPGLASLEFVPRAPEPEREPDPPVSSGMSCLRVGPFGEEERVLAASREVAERGLRARVQDEQTQIWRGHWVQVFVPGSRETVNETVTEVRAAGVQDAYVVAWEPVPRISLGVFRQRDRAEFVISQARSIGLEPVMNDRFSPATAWWLTLERPAGTEFDMSELGDVAGQIIRSEPVPCGEEFRLSLESPAEDGAPPE